MQTFTKNIYFSEDNSINGGLRAPAAAAAAAAVAATACMHACSSNQVLPCTLAATAYQGLLITSAATPNLSVRP